MIRVSRTVDEHKEMVISVIDVLTELLSPQCSKASVFRVWNRFLDHLGYKKPLFHDYFTYARFTVSKRPLIAFRARYLRPVAEWIAESRTFSRKDRSMTRQEFIERFITLSTTAMDRMVIIVGVETQYDTPMRWKDLNQKERDDLDYVILPDGQRVCWVERDTGESWSEIKERLQAEEEKKKETGATHQLVPKRKASA